MNLSKNIDELYKEINYRNIIFTLDELKEKINLVKKNIKFSEIIASNNYTNINVIPALQINNFEEWMSENDSLQKIFENLYEKKIHSIVIKVNCEMNSEIYSEIEKGVKNVPIQLILNSFVKDDLLIYEIKSVGIASIVFKISKYTIPELKRYLKICDELNLFAVANCENKKEVEIALSLDFKYISIASSADKKNININNSQILRRNIPNKIITISSGNIRNVNQLKQLNSIGFDAAIVNLELIDKLNF